MKFAELQGTKVVSLADGSTLGSVEDLVLDLSQQQALGLRIKRSGLFAGHEAVLLHDVRAIGPDAVTVDDASKVNDEDRFPQFQGRMHRDAVVGARMLTEGGTEVGTVADLDVDFASGAITSYVLRGGLATWLRHTEHVVPVSVVKTVGDKIIVVADTVTSA
jgi:uncharacterized protein YrrD